MTKSIATLPVLAVVVLLMTAQPAAAQGYEGLLEDDGGAATSTYDAGSDPANQLDAYAPDYYKKKRELDAADSAQFKSARAKQAEEAKKQRAEQAKATQEKIDARVKAAVSAPSAYDTRLSDIKAVPSQVPQETPEVQQPTPAPVSTGTATGGGAGSVGDRDTRQNRGIMERMMNALE